MICSVCRRELPARFALATSLTTVVCTGCGTALRPTIDSAGYVARRMFPPFAKVGLVVGGGGTWYGLATGRWWPLCVALGLGIAASVAVSWWHATKHLVFEQA